ncbi:MAG: hypothetical protein CVU17_03885 [Betaproteobacteria bacterium HGW-Betaproteobacteria-11]|nr:MAG: hypothetical protein CVU17_03885 [Betaproteobacteria bacterium HGW-Betaproteobacteria-11]
MRTPHPASLILLWLALLAATASHGGPLLLLVTLALVLAALVLAAPHLHRLLRRSRWLLLTLFVLFAWMTPGTPLPWLPGISSEGLQLAAEHVLRLVLALATLALVLQILSPVALVAGIRSLLAPLAAFGLSRDRIAVRLALTLEEVERARGAAGVQGNILHLPQMRFGATDALLGVLASSLLATLWL